MRASVEAFTHFFLFEGFFLVTCSLFYSVSKSIVTYMCHILYIYVIICILYIHILQETFLSLCLVSSLFSYLLAIKGIYWFDYWKVLGYNWFQAWLDPGAKANYVDEFCFRILLYIFLYLLFFLAESLYSGPQKI